MPNYTPGWVVNPGDTPSSTKWDQLGANDDNFFARLQTGWNDVTDAWAYASATGINGVITVPSDATLTYTKGDRVRLTQSATVKYFVIIAVTATTLTVTGGTDYTLTNVAITAISFSKVAAPVGFPMWFNYTPTYGASGSMTATYSSAQQTRFSVVGNTCKILFDALLVIGGTPSFFAYATAPITPLADLDWTGAGYASNTGGFNVRWDATATPKAFGWRKYDGGNHAAGTFLYAGMVDYQI